MKNYRPSPESLDAYQRLARHERGLWITTVAIVVMSAVTIAVLTAAAAMTGAFAGPYRGFILAGGSFVLLGLFIVYVGVQRETLEENRIRILRELESRSGELKQANRSMEEALKARDVFLNSVSHELKTPLTCIMAYAEYVAEQDLEISEARAHAQAIVQEGRGLLGLIDRIVDVSRIRSGTLKLDREPTDLNRIVGRVLEVASDEAEARNIALYQQLESQELHAWVDGARIEQVVDCLVRHALNRSEADTVVYIRTESADSDWAKIVVENQGYLATADEQDAMFKPFGSLDPHPQGRAGDLGLALPLAKRLVMAHGGILHLAEGDPQGVVFSVILPRRQPSLAALVPEESEGDEPTSLRRAS